MVNQGNWFAILLFWNYRLAFFMFSFWGTV